jgi:hypothetical protein
MFSHGMKSRMSRLLRGSEARIPSQADRGARKLARRRFVTLSDAGSDAKQNALWAQLMAERPDMLSNVVSFIQGARRRIVDPPSRRAKARSDDA